MGAIPTRGWEGGGEAGRKLPFTSLVAGALALCCVTTADRTALPRPLLDCPLFKNALTALAAILEDSLPPTDRGSLQGDTHQFLVQQVWY